MKFAAVISAAVGVVSAAKKFRGLQALQYDEAEAFQAYGYCAASSCNVEDYFLDWTCEVCLNGIATIPPPNIIIDRSIIEDEDEIAHAIFGYDEAKDRVVVAFQGTTNTEQFFANLDIGLQTYAGPDGGCDGCRAVNGFYNAWKTIDDEVVARVHELCEKYDTNDVFIAGYSLGGALASHAALRLAFVTANGENLNLVVYTLGQPRIANQEFADYFTPRVPNLFRIINYNDPVPALITGTNYKHLPQEIWYYEPLNVGGPPGDYIILDDQDGEDPNGQVQDCLNPNPFRICLNFNNHYTYFNAPTVSDGPQVCGPLED